jgi:hypothetical protein
MVRIGARVPFASGFGKSLAGGRLRAVDVVGLVNDTGDPATSNDSFNHVAVNLLYWLIDQRAGLGGKYLHGRRELRNGAHGSDSRVQLGHASPPDRHLGVMSRWPGRHYRLRPIPLA